MKNEIIQKALEFATQAHEGQFRKCGKVPYITHPIGVANLVEKVGGSTEQIVIALLHDVIEDCDGYDYKRIKDEFGTDTAEGVLDLTNTSKTDRPELNRGQRKMLDNARLAKIPYSSKVVKLADIYYNVHDLKGMNEGFISRFLQEKFNQTQAMMAKHVNENDSIDVTNPAVAEMYDGILAKIRKELAARGWVHIHEKGRGPKWEKVNQ